MYKELFNIAFILGVIIVLICLALKSKNNLKLQKMKTELYFYPDSNVPGLENFEPKEPIKRRSVVAGVINPEAGTLSLGKTECSLKDVFVKKKGRNIAHGRALSSHPLRIIQLETKDYKEIVKQFVDVAKEI